MELHNYIQLETINNPSSCVLIDSYDIFKRKHNINQYIGVDVLNFLAIPKFKQQSNLFLKPLPVNSDIRCEHGFTVFSEKKHFLLQKMSGK